MKNRKYHTVGTVPKSNRKIVERGKIKIDTPTHKYMTVHCPGLVQALQSKVAGLNLFYGPKTPLLVKRCSHESAIQMPTLTI